MSTSDDLYNRIINSPQSAPGVQSTPEFTRIKNLKRRVLDLSTIPDYTPLFKTAEGTMRLRPIQNAMLHEAKKMRGLFAAVGVGHGKTLVSLLLPHVIPHTSAILLLPPRLEKSLYNLSVLPHYTLHFKLPRTLKSMSYSALSSPLKYDMLEMSSPDLIIADEAHFLRHRTSVRTRRLLRYLREHPECRVCVLSGTLITKSISDYSHLMEAALRIDSPVPRDYPSIQSWEGVLIEDGPPGCLVEFCKEGESVREGFSRRLFESAGVVHTKAQSCDASITIYMKSKIKSEKIDDAIREVKNKWAIGGEEFCTALEISEVQKQIACGFYYKWEWETTEDREWLEARSNWHKAVRQYLRYHNKPGMDSPFLLARAADEGRWEAGLEFWEKWKAVKHRKPPKNIPVWLDSVVFEEIYKWANNLEMNGERGIIWYEYEAVANVLEHNYPWPCYHSGMDAQLDSATAPVIVCSRNAFGIGKNLQNWNHNLVITPPSSAAVWEQLIGRTHREGQEADEVCVDVFVNTWETLSVFERAIEDAKLVQDISQQPQKLVYANKIYI